MIFPDCEIIECEQRSEEWHEARRGLLTASEFGAWLLKQTTATERNAWESAISRCVSRAAGAWEKPVFENEAMKRGTELEPEAVASFETATGLSVRQVGFCRSKVGLFGCSPDGLIDSTGEGLESKVPEGPTHVRYRRAGELPDAYRFQVQGSMAVTGAEAWWFQSYQPGLAPLRIRIERDETTEALRRGLLLFSEALKDALAEEKAAWDRAFGKGAA